MIECILFCNVCRQEFDWHKGYGLDIRCCSKECFKEADWRRTLSILGENYRPQKKAETPKGVK